MPPRLCDRSKIGQDSREQASKTLQPLEAKESVLPGWGGEGRRPRADGHTSLADAAGSFLSEQFQSPTSSRPHGIAKDSHVLESLSFSRKKRRDSERCRTPSYKVVGAAFECSSAWLCFP